MKVGLIARSDRTGLGNQTRNLARLLNPDRVMLIDSSFFNGNKQHPETYMKYATTFIEGFPTDSQVEEWIEGLDVVITCEIFYNSRFVDIANKMGVKTINQYNWEFADYLQNPNMTLPTKLVAPSKWRINEAISLWGDRVAYLPTPVFTDDYEDVKGVNMVRQGHKRFLHVMGRQAVNDRNGTRDLIKALRYCHEDFELVIKKQTGDLRFLTDDYRVTIDDTSPENEIELYRGFDAMILPRKYAGQCLPMNEALCAGLPVIMTDISPNNHILPAHWLCEATKEGMFMARTWIEVFAANPVKLAERIDQFASKDLHSYKVEAYNRGYNEFSDEVLKQKWERLIEEVVGNNIHSGAV